MILEWLVTHWPGPYSVVVAVASVAIVARSEYQLERRGDR